MKDIIPLFSTPFYKSRIEEYDYSEAFFQLDSAKFKDTSNGVWISTDDYVIDRMPMLKQQIINHVNRYLFEGMGYVPFDYYFPDSWFVKIGPTGLSGMHRHCNSLYSGIVYLECPGAGGEIRFYSPDGGSTNNVVRYMIDKKVNNLFNSEDWVFSPEKGDIMMFPSYCMHNVLVNRSNRNRYSFAFNILPFNYKCNEPGGKVI